MSRSKPFNRFYKMCVTGFALGFTALLVYTGYVELLIPQEDELAYGKYAKPYDISHAEMGVFVDDVVRFLNQESKDVSILEPHRELLSYPVHLDIYENNRPLGEAYTFGGDLEVVKASLLQTYQLNNAQGAPLIGVDATIVVSVFYEPNELDFLSGKVNQVLGGAVVPGRSGAMVSCQDSALLMPPMRWITRGMMNARAGVFTYLSPLGCPKDADVGPGGGRVVVFKTQDYIQRKRGAETEEWLGIDRALAMSAVSKPRMEQFLKQSADWLLEHMDEEGALTYYYYPLYDQVSEENQLVRQWLATRALGEIAEYFNDDTLRQVYLKNARYNINAYGVVNDAGLSFPLEGYAYLSTNNMAAHALTAVPKGLKEYRNQYQAIMQVIKQQLRDDGLFDSIVTVPDGVKKSSKGQDRHFAPGSAMIALGDAIANGTIELDPAVFKPTFEFYFDYWKRQKRLYGSAWQAQGYYHMYEAYKTHDYLDATIEVADHLLSCQITEHERVELIGAYGAPHCNVASTRSTSSGVRLEAVVVGYRAAKILKDEDRMQRYRASARLAMRHILQGQMTEDNIFYLPNPKRAMGAIRDQYHVNSVRIDNVAHTVNGVYAALTYIDGLFD